MLRGQIPQDRNPQEIVFDNIFEVDDVWTLLFYSMLGSDDYGELWYWGGTRNHRFDDNFVERWVPSFATYRSKFRPRVIFCRGGFPEYHHILNRFPNAIKIYYGAGSRFLPQSGFNDYDIILQDSSAQVKICAERFPNALTTLFIKPAADNIFYPMPEVKKEHDVCFPANAAQAFKGHKFVYSTVPKHLKVLNLGNRTGRFPHPKNVTSYRVLRPQMAKHIAKCKMGIVAVESNIDSCPRVIPELLACGLPIVVLDGVRFWVKKYLAQPSRRDLKTGIIADKEDFWNAVEWVLKNRKIFSPRKYYEEELSLKKAAEFMRNKIDEVRI
jgi:hypothetical protein